MRKQVWDNQLGICLNIKYFHILIVFTDNKTGKTNNSIIYSIKQIILLWFDYYYFFRHGSIIWLLNNITTDGEAPIHGRLLILLLATKSHGQD